MMNRKLVIMISLILFNPNVIWAEELYSLPNIHQDDIVKPQFSHQMDLPVEQGEIKALKKIPVINIKKPQLSPAMIDKIKKMPYNDKVFNITYNTLLYNSHIFDAYQIALIAVAKNPTDLSWHEKLAEAANWAGDYATGMKEWSYLVNHSKNPNIIKKAISTSKALGYNDLLIYTLKIHLAKNPNDIKSYIELARAQNQIGLPKVGIATLNKLNATHPQREAYELIASIYYDMDDWDKALNIWQEIDKIYGPNIKSVMAEALIYYSKTDFKEAVSILKKGLPIAKGSDVEFWQTLADLAWNLNDRALALTAYSKGLNDESNLSRLIELTRNNNPKQAYSYSLKGWQQFHNQAFLSNALYFAQILKQWYTINDLLINLSNKEIIAYSKDQFFWGVLESLYVAFGAEKLQRELLIEGIMLYPKMNQLKSNLLWLVMTNGEARSIKALMNLWYQDNLLDDPLLWHAMAEGFDVLNLFYPSILMYQHHIFSNPEDYQVLVDYGNILEKALLYQQSYSVKENLWEKLRNENTDDPIDSKKILQALSQIAPYFASGTEQVNLFNNLLLNNMEDQDINIILNWLVPRKYYALISYFKYYYLVNHLPDWAEINLALIKNDLPSLQNIMTHTDRSWPRSDRINAAVRLENLPLAYDLGFAELTERRLANEIYPELTQYGLELSNKLRISEAEERFVNVSGKKTNLEASFRLTNSLKMMPFIGYWNIHSNDEANITNVPASDFNSTIKLEQKIHRGKVLYSLGYRNVLNGFTPASVDVNYQLNSRLTGNLKLGFDQEDFQNAYLRFGGLQDQINMNLMFNATQYDLISAEVQGLNYYGQDRHYLANGVNLLGYYQHKFWLSYPDYTVGVFGNIYSFNRNGSFGGNITTLFPALTPEQQANPTLAASTQTFNYQQLIPNTYYEGGLQFSFGNAITEYTHAWRPYFWGALYYNTITLLSNDLKGGINGSVFGRDSLLIYAERGTAPATPNAINYSLGARYSLYF